MNNEQRDEFFRLMTAGIKEAEQAYLALMGKAMAEHLKKLFNELVADHTMAQQKKESTMKPNQMIHEAGMFAAFKVREALNEFVQTTGMRPEMEISWLDYQNIDERNSRALVDKVTIRVNLEVTP